MSISFVEVTIPSGASVSNVVDLQGNIPVGIFTDPQGMTGTTLTFNAFQNANGTPPAYGIRAAGGASAYSLTIAAAEYLGLDSSVFPGVRWLQAVSGSSEAAARTLYIATQTAKF